MRLLLQLFSLLAHLIAVIVFTGVASVAWSHLDARRFEGGETPPSMFPLVAHVGGSFELVRWGGAREPLAGKGAFRLPLAEGNFDLPPIGHFTPQVRFRVLEADAAGQRIEVNWSDEDYHFESRYFTDGTALEPEYYRHWGPSMAFIGLIPGILGAWLLGRGVRALWRRGRRRQITAERDS